ncbi:unnamed protein product [Durusdinium trenchii]|uniref:Ion transport domain-containing protein n=1 Tax=Durusdinium trenchii TaxID=1381693 RepID=A0ABP0IXW0_9DINO
MTVNSTVESPLLANSPIRSLVAPSRELSGEGKSNRSTRSNFTREFQWNSKRCSGNDLHVAAMQGDRLEVQRLLELHPEWCQSRFTCQALLSPRCFEGRPHVEMSGEAIHLAASRGHLEILKDLLSHKASLQAGAYKDGRPYCEVLHAALLCLSEDFASTKATVNFLLEEAEMTCTSTGRHPLHLAVNSGKPELICLVRHWMKKKGITEEDLPTSHEVIEDSVRKTCFHIERPLTVAIQSAKMKLKDLVLSAEPSAFSLKMFMADCPEAVPLFLKRMTSLGKLEGILVDSELSSLDVANLMKQSELAALSLLDAATVRPRCQDWEMYPLPSTVSFASRDWEQLVWNLSNRGTLAVEAFTFLEPEDHWTAGSRWHETLLDTHFGRPIRDADIQVCQIPDLISTQLFLVLASDDIDLQTFDNRLITFIVLHVFEHHAGKVEAVRCVVNVWILALLNLHTWSMHHNELLPGIIWVAVRFLAAQSAVDILWEAIQIYGYAAIGQPWEYWSVGNLLDFCAAVVPTYLWLDPSNHPVLVVTIFIYWGRVLHFASFCEPIGRELQPFTKIFRGLGPVLFVTMVAFAAFSHAFFILQPESFSISIYGTFVTLMTAGLPEEPSPNLLESGLLYIAVTFFTVFILNIFIGVIGDEYSRLKSQSFLGFRQIRAKMCLDYMLRKQFFRIDWCSKRMSKIVLLTLIQFGLVIQLFSTFNNGHPYESLEGGERFSPRGRDIFSTRVRIFFAGDDRWTRRYDLACLFCAVPFCYTKNKAIGGAARV